MISDARRRPVPPIPWNLDVFFAFSIGRTVWWYCVRVVAFSVFSIRITIGDLVRRSSPCTCHPVEPWRLLHLLDSIDGVVISYPRRLSELPIADQKRVCTSTCQSLRERRALDINSWQVTRCRPCLLIVYIRPTNMRFISVECRIPVVEGSMTAVIAGPVSLQFTSVSRTYSSSVLNVEYLLWRVIWPSWRSDVNGARAWFGSKITAGV